MCTYNDGSKQPPRLQIFLNLMTLEDLPPDSSGPSADAPDLTQRLLADGFEGVQVAHNAPMPPDFALPFCGMDRINLPEEADAVFRLHAERGDLCLTLHVGWGMEDDGTACHLFEAIAQAAAAHRLPAFIETHRATLFQDMWRTVQFLQKFPELLINGDFSHFYCGQEMVYGGFANKIAFMQPIFDRVAFLHGRIASPGCMQAPIEAIDQRPRLAQEDQDYLEHFKAMWIRAMKGFLKLAREGDILIFAPEILSPRIYYAQLAPGPDGQLREFSDRYAQALLLRDLARSCFRQAQILTHP